MQGLKLRVEPGSDLELKAMLAISDCSIVPSVSLTEFEIDFSCS